MGSLLTTPAKQDLKFHNTNNPKLIIYLFTFSISPHETIQITVLQFISYPTMIIDKGIEKLTSKFEELEIIHLASKLKDPNLS